MTGWQFWIDRGGTFTDVIGLAPSGELHIRKVLSVQPGAADGGDPGIRAARNILGATSQETPEGRVDAVKVGTTVATNALLERKGEPVLLVTTVGFADGLRIGYQSRPDLFARHIVLPDRLYPQVIEANERVDAAGMVLTPLDTERLRSDLERARQAGLRSVAIISSWLASSATRARGRGHRARSRFRGSLGVARALAARPLRRAWRHHRA